MFAYVFIFLLLLLIIKLFNTIQTSLKLFVNVLPSLRGLNDSQFQEFLELDWLPNPIRGCSYFYGFDSLVKFLDRNNLSFIVRAHECFEEGFYFHFAG